MHIFGELDFNCTQLDPPGTIIVIHNRPNYRESWEQHVESGWYIGPYMGHYRFHKTYNPITRAEHISYTVLNCGGSGSTPILVGDVRTVSVER